MKFFLTAISLLCFCQISLAQITPKNITVANTPPDAVQKLIDEIDKMNNDPVVETAAWGIYVYNISGGTEVFNYNGVVCLTPASTMKVLTAGAGFGILGTGYKFTTYIQYDGKLDSLTGILDGNIYIKGSGDPTLGNECPDSLLSFFFHNWAKAIYNKGIRKINGYIIADDEIFDDEYVAPYWNLGDISTTYGAGVSGLNINQNTYSIVFKPGMNEGDSTTVVGFYPKPTDVTFINEVITDAPGSDAGVYVDCPLHAQHCYLRGSIPAGSSKIAVPTAMMDPATLCAVELWKELQVYRVEVEKGATTIRRLREQKTYVPLSRKTILEINSSSLYNIVKKMLHYSINLYAESILKTLGSRKSGGGSFASGSRSIQGYWAARGVKTKGMRVMDGSGLSRANCFSPQQMIQALSAITKSGYYKSILDGLPVVYSTKYVKVKAKSGTMSGVKCYSGYVFTKTGKTLAFSIMFNNFSGSFGDIKKRFDRLFMLMGDI
ncbi:MAG: D-alanyl-D-alanine carboxypeptidase/D-alanyl-D-alanine-endopeptidase [Bacteroidota bacterium]